MRPLRPARPRSRLPRASTSTVVVGGGAPAVPTVELAPQPAEPTSPQLFTRTNATGFMAPREFATPDFAVQQSQPVVGGGEAALIGAPGESIEVATGALQPSRPYTLPNGAGYRGPGVRAANVHAAGHSVGGQPVPPALASQVQSMVYGAQVGNPNDPLLTWSNASREQASPVPMPVAAPQGVAPMPQQQAQPMQQVRTVPMEPPAGVYAPQPGMAAQPAAPADPFLARAEQGGGVSFG